MRVLFVDQSAELGGAELSLFQQVISSTFPLGVLLFEDGPLAGMLAEAGVEVDVIHGAAGTIKVRRESGLLPAFTAIPAVLALCWGVWRRARKYDLIYANSQKAFVVSALAALVAGRPVVWHLHDILTAAHFGKFLRRFAVRLSNLTARWVIANSNATAAAFRSLGGRADRLSVVHQGIDEAPFLALQAAEVAALRASLGGGSLSLVGVFGRLAPWKGQALFLQALAQLPNVIGVVVGEALFGEAAYADELHAKVAAMGLSGRVRFLGFREDIPLVMSAMDVIVHTSIAPEPFGRVVVEGMLAGKPVIASGAGGVLEIIEHGKTGFLYEAGNAAALAGTIAKVLAEPEMASAVATAGHAHARQNFSARASIDNISETLASLV